MAEGPSAAIAFVGSRFGDVGCRVDQVLRSRHGQIPTGVGRKRDAGSSGLNRELLDRPRITGVITGATGSRPLMHDLTARFTAALDQFHRNRDADP
jgi:hypothetical protein